MFPKLIGFSVCVTVNVCFELVKLLCQYPKLKGIRNHVAAPLVKYKENDTSNETRENSLFSANCLVHINLQKELSEATMVRSGVNMINARGARYFFLCIVHILHVCSMYITD